MPDDSVGEFPEAERPALRVLIARLSKRAKDLAFKERSPSA